MELTAMELHGQKESYALLQINAAPPPIEAFAGLGLHAIDFSGEVDLSAIFEPIDGLHVVFGDSQSPAGALHHIDDSIAQLRRRAMKRTSLTATLPTDVGWAATCVSHR
jgi:hypothetical protein